MAQSLSSLCSPSLWLPLHLHSPSRRPHPLTTPTQTQENFGSNHCPRPPLAATCCASSASRLLLHLLPAIAERTCMSQKTAETSVTSLSHSKSLHRPSQIRTVATVPRMLPSEGPFGSLSIDYLVFCAAWARDEPPSPTDPDQHNFLSAPSHESLRRPSDVASYQSSDSGPSCWWTFTLPRPQRTNTLTIPPP